jgi:hypothetical protein
VLSIDFYKYKYYVMKLEKHTAIANVGY